MPIHKRPYFDSETLELDGEEIFVDVGGFNGDTLSDFLEFTKGNFTLYYFIEPGEQMFETARQKYGTNEKIIWIQKGIAEKTCRKNFVVVNYGMLEMTADNEKSEVDLEVLALDDIENLTPTLVKMDIEGGECAALDGAEKILNRYKPKLAICVYHRPKDLVEIYRRLKQHGYKKFFLRAELGTLDYDIVLYAS